MPDWRQIPAISPWMRRADVAKKDPMTTRVEMCATCGAAMEKIDRPLLTSPLQYLWRCTGCHAEAYIAEALGLEYTPRHADTEPPPAPSGVASVIVCAHAEPECDCPCHANPCILHDHACCSPCPTCGFRVRCTCAHCQGRPAAPSSR